VWSVNVLLVDDDAADTMLVLDILKRHPEVSTARASNAPEAALQEFAGGRARPDLVLLDIHMPRIDGFEFLRRMRRIPRMVETPVVFLTTSGLSRDALMARESSAACYVVKPQTHSNLQARLDVVIQRVISGDWSR
jgi:CheY-like chemotaxis protein